MIYFPVIPLEHDPKEIKNLDLLSIPVYFKNINSHLTIWFVYVILGPE